MASFVPVTTPRRTQSFYAVLGVRNNAGDDEIREAYKRKVIEVHPDKPGGTTQKFRSVQKAYENIKTKDARRQYDQSLKEEKKAKNFSSVRPKAWEETVKHPMDYVLMDGKPYTFETAAEKMRSKFRHGDVVRGPSGDQGVIIGIATDGIYWMKAAEGFASLLFSPDFGGDRDILLMFRDQSKARQNHAHYTATSRMTASQRDQQARSEFQEKAKKRRVEEALKMVEQDEIENRQRIEAAVELYWNDTKTEMQEWQKKHCTKVPILVGADGKPMGLRWARKTTPPPKEENKGTTNNNNNGSKKEPSSNQPASMFSVLSARNNSSSNLKTATSASTNEAAASNSTKQSSSSSASVKSPSFAADVDFPLGKSYTPAGDDGRASGASTPASAVSSGKENRFRTSSASASQVPRKSSISQLTGGAKNRSSSPSFGATVSSLNTSTSGSTTTGPGSGASAAFRSTIPRLAMPDKPFNRDPSAAQERSTSAKRSTSVGGGPSSSRLPQRSSTSMGTTSATTPNHTATTPPTRTSTTSGYSSATPRNSTLSSSRRSTTGNSSAATPRNTPTATRVPLTARTPRTSTTSSSTANTRTTSSTTPNLASQSYTPRGTAGSRPGLTSGPKGLETPRQSRSREIRNSEASSNVPRSGSITGVPKTPRIIGEDGTPHLTRSGKRAAERNVPRSSTPNPTQRYGLTERRSNLQKMLAETRRLREEAEADRADSQGQ